MMGGLLAVDGLMWGVNTLNKMTKWKHKGLETIALIRSVVFMEGAVN